MAQSIDDAFRALVVACNENTEPAAIVAKVEIVLLKIGRGATVPRWPEIGIDDAMDPAVAWALGRACTACDAVLGTGPGPRSREQWARETFVQALRAVMVVAQ